jgi:hypothetical protein
MAYARYGRPRAPAWARYGRCKPVAKTQKTALASRLELVAPIPSYPAKASEHGRKPPRTLDFAGRRSRAFAGRHSQREALGLGLALPAEVVEQPKLALEAVMQPPGLRRGPRRREGHHSDRVPHTRRFVFRAPRLQPPSKTLNTQPQAPDRSPQRAHQPSRYLYLALGVSISLDELAIGFSAGLLRLPVLPLVIAVAVQAFLVTQIGLHVGARAGATLREACRVSAHRARRIACDRAPELVQRSRSALPMVRVNGERPNRGTLAVRSYTAE